MTVSSDTDDFFCDLFRRVGTIAVVGFSANPQRPSHDVASYLHALGFRIIPVNPGLAGQTHLGETVYPDLSSIPLDVDMVDIFRRAEAVPAIVEDALSRWTDLRVVWMQLGIAHAAAAQKASDRGVTVIENRCPKIELPRLFRAGKLSPETVGLT